MFSSLLVIYVCMSCFVCLCFLNLIFPHEALKLHASQFVCSWHFLWTHSSNQCDLLYLIVLRAGRFCPLCIVCILEYKWQGDVPVLCVLIQVIKSHKFDRNCSSFIIVLLELNKNYTSVCFEYMYMFSSIIWTFEVLQAQKLEHTSLKRVCTWESLTVSYKVVCFS